MHVYADQNQYHGSEDSLQAVVEMVEEYMHENDQSTLKDLFMEAKADGKDDEDAWNWADAAFVESVQAETYTLDSLDAIEAISGTKAEDFISITKCAQCENDFPDKDPRNATLRWCSRRTRSIRT